jgi:hypothetical protein
MLLDLIEHFLAQIDGQLRGFWDIDALYFGWDFLTGICGIPLRTLVLSNWNLIHPIFLEVGTWNTLLRMATMFSSICRECEVICNETYWHSQIVSQCECVCLSAFQTYLPSRPCPSPVPYPFLQSSLLYIQGVPDYGTVPVILIRFPVI